MLSWASALKPKVICGLYCRPSMIHATVQKSPPRPGAGIAMKTHMCGCAPELTILRKGLQTRKILGVFEMFEKTGCLFKVTRSYFLSCRHSLTPDPPCTLPLTPISQYPHLPLCTNRARAQGRAPNLLTLPCPHLRISAGGGGWGIEGVRGG